MADQELKNISRLSEEIWLVPCIANTGGNYFKPVYEPKFLGLKTSSVKNWSKVEDKILRKMVEEKGEQAWGQITTEFNAIVGRQDGKKTRECKDRWDNHLNPRLKKGKWTAEEDLLILRLKEERGSKWSFISQLLPGRTQHSVKNRWMSLNILANKRWPESTDPIGRLLQEKRNTQSSGDKQDFCLPKTDLI